VSLPAQQAQFVIPELAVKSSVMRHQRDVADKVSHFAHHRRNRRCRAQHGIADAGKPLDFRRHPHTRIHQALIAVQFAAILPQHHGNFGYPAANRR
jgi:hypothetical protein